MSTFIKCIQNRVIYSMGHCNNVNEMAKHLKKAQENIVKLTLNNLEDVKAFKKTNAESNRGICGTDWKYFT